MAIRVYLTPKTGTGTEIDRFRPKYFRELGITGKRSMDYGLEDLFLVVVNVTAQQHADLTANADVIAVPQNLDAQVGANLTAVQNALEGVNLPGLLVEAQHTYRQVVFGIVGIMKLAQVYRRMFGVSWFAGGVTLATTMSELTQQQRDRLRAVAERFGIDYSGVTGGATMRQVLWLLARRLPTECLLGETVSA